MDVVTFGESMILINPETRGSLRYINNFSKSFGGAESNVAIALSKLGHKIGWFSRLGNEELGRYIHQAIRGEGVDVSRVIFDEVSNTGLMVKERTIGENPNVYYYRKNSAASNLNPDDLDEDYIKEAKILHITGITLAISKSARETVYRAIELARRHNVTVTFDPNIRLKLWSLEEAREVILDVARKADIIFPGIDEAKLLLGIDDEKLAAKEFLAMGCKLVCVKLGEKGCYIQNESESLYVEGFEVKNVEDTAGAGDGFAAGFLSGMLRSLPLEECGRMANAVGAMAIQVRGDMEGYPSYEQLQAFMGKGKSIDR